MLNLRRKTTRICLLAGLVGLAACVDKDYDLSDVNTDEITVGNALVAPLGSGLISAKKLLDVDNVQEIKVNVQGDYVARYPGEMLIEMPSNPELEDFDFLFPDLSITLPFPSGEVPRDIDLQTGDTEHTISLTTTSEVVRLDSVIFTSDRRQSLLNLFVNKSGFDVVSGTAKLNVEIDFPAGYELEPSNLPTGAVLTDGTLTYSAELLGFNGVNLQLHLAKVVASANDQIVCKTSLSFKQGSLVNITGAQGLSISSGIKDPVYEVIYGEFDTSFATEDVSIDMNGLDNIFKGQDNMLSFVDPHILFETESNIGIPLEAAVAIASRNNTTGKEVATSVEGLPLTAPLTFNTVASNKIWIGSDAKKAPAEYVFIQNDALNDIVKIAPQAIRFHSNVSSKTRTVMFFPNKPAAKLRYTVEIPFAPALDFKATLDQNLDDVFDQDLIDYLFSGGSAEIYGNVTNSMPVNLSMNMIITDRNDRPVGITLAPQQIAAGSGTDKVSPVTFNIKETDMPKMKNARNIVLELTVTGSDQTQGVSLRPEQEVKLDLKIRKHGGITIKND